MLNKDIARVFYEIADYQDILGIEWKPKAFRRAAQIIEGQDYDAEKIYTTKGIKGLQEIPGIGDALSKKIEEYILTGKIKEHEKLKKQIPPGLLHILELPNIGPKKSSILYKTLKIKNISELEKSAREGKIANIKGFGEKTQQEIIKAIQEHAKRTQRTPYTIAYKQAEQLRQYILKQPNVQQATIAGSIRRKETTIGDIDILATSTTPEQLSDAIIKYPEVKDVIAKGTTKTSIHLTSGIQADIRIVPKESYGSALQYFTGNKQHNVQLRIIANKKGMKLSEYGLYNAKTGERIAGETENEIYTLLGLKMPKPEKRKGI